MRRFRAIYLVIIFIVVVIGAGFAGYYWMILPNIDKVTKSQSEWKASRSAMKEVESSYEQSLQAQVDNSKQLFNNYHIFAKMQAQMPPIYNMKEYYTGREREGLRKWYIDMGTGKVIKDLNSWVRGFHLNKAYSVEFSQGPLGFEDSLTDVKIVKVNFGDITVTAHGYPDLINKLQRMSGYGYFPLIIEPAGKKVDITVVQTDPKKPTLRMTVTATGYFMTRGWDPNGAAVKDQVMQAKTLAENPPVPQPSITGFDRPCPKVLWFLEAEDTNP